MLTKLGIRKLLGLTVLSLAMCLFGFNFLLSGHASAAPAESRVAQPTVPTPPPIVLLSPSSSGKVAGIKFKDEDILLYEPSAGSWSLYFDGSAVKIGKTDITDFELIDEGPHGAILMSFDTPIKLPGLGTVDDSDIVKFVLDNPAPVNSIDDGHFESCFDGSQFDLSTSSEDIDAIAFDAQGRLVISVIGKAKLNGTSLLAEDKDLIVFSQAPFTCNPAAGSWSIYMDGSDIQLTTGAEDIDAAWIDAGGADKNIYLSTKNVFSAASGATTASGNGAIIFGFSPVTLGENTTTGVLFGSFHPEIGGYLETVDGLFLIGGTNLRLARSAQGVIDAGITAAGVDSEEQYEVLTEVADESSAELDSYDSALDALSAEEIRSTIYLPFVAIQ
jgi:hypothetical protein